MEADLALKTVFALGVLAMVAAGCSQPGLSLQDTSVAASARSAATVPAAARDYRVAAFVFHSPDDLTVSEGNGYYPFADIVWRGDPYGNRVEQISDMFETAVLQAGRGLDGAIPVAVEITLRKFHALTERTRYTVGGVHTIRFELTIRNFETREILEGPRLVDASFPGLGGMAAIAAEQRGETQKVRILSRLTQVFTDELRATSATATGR